MLDGLGLRCPRVACFVVEDERQVNHDIIPHIAFKIKTQPYVSHN
jgi:hypothetical protein